MTRGKPAALRTVFAVRHRIADELANAHASPCE
jgi:hypothetical protein